MQSDNTMDAMCTEYENYPKEELEYTPPSSPEKDNASDASHKSPKIKFRRCRTAFTTEQLAVLEREFALDRYISRFKRKDIADEIGIPENTVKVWFQNRRMRVKRDQSLNPWPYGRLHPAGATNRMPLSFISPYTSYLYRPPYLPTFGFPSWSAVRPNLYYTPSLLSRALPAAPVSLARQ